MTNEECKRYNLNSNISLAVLFLKQLAQKEIFYTIFLFFSLQKKNFSVAEKRFFCCGKKDFPLRKLCISR